MSDFFSRLEKELVAAAERRAHGRRLPHLRWTRRTAVIVIPAALILVGVPAFAAVSGVFHASRSKHVVNLNPKPCLQRHPLQPQTSTAQPPQDLIAKLGVLRRPKTAGDRVEGSLALFPDVAGVNLGYLRVRRPRHALSLIVYPAENIHARMKVPNTPACRPLREPRRTPQAGACLVIRFHNAGGGACSTLAELRRGGLPSALSGGGIAHGGAIVAGLVPDGVKRVTLTFAPQGHPKTVNLTVVENTYAALVGHIRPDFRPRVIWHGTGGSRVIAGGKSPTTTARMQSLARRSRARDFTATHVPSVFPREGGAEALFTLRVRPPFANNRRSLYRVTLIGLGTDGCRQRGRRDFIEFPSRYRRPRGLITAFFTPDEMGGGRRWCPATYRGRVSFLPHGLHSHAPRLEGRFSFSVR